MVSAVGQIPPQSTEPLWAYQQRQDALQKTVLTPDLQKLADIINDTSGKYSEADKINAYTTAYDSFYETTRSGDVVSVTQTASEGQLQEKFADVIKNSGVGRAVGTGQQALVTFQRTTGITDDATRLQFFSELTPLQQKLPQFKDFGTPLAVLFQQASQASRDVVDLSTHARKFLNSDKQA
jgi:hypothetical protein